MKNSSCKNCNTNIIIPFQPFKGVIETLCPQCNYPNYNSNYVRIDIGLSEVCNLNCNMCRRPQEKMFLDFSFVLSVLKDAKLIGVKTVSFSGGEPFVYPNFRKLLRQAIDLGLEIELVTNGTLINENDIETLEKLKCVTISIDGIESTHDYIRGNIGCWKKSMNTIKLLHKSKAKWGINTVIQKINSKELIEMWLEIKKRGRPSYISFNHVEVVPETEELLPENTDVEFIKKSIEFIREECKSLNIHFNDPLLHGENSKIFIDKTHRYRPYHGCNIPSKFLGISRYGIFPCWHQGKYIQSNSLIEALKSELCSEIIREGVEKKCIGCNASNYSWDSEYVQGIIKSHNNGIFDLGIVSISKEEREGIRSNKKEIPFIERKKNEYK